MHLIFSTHSCPLGACCHFFLHLIEMESDAALRWNSYINNSLEYALNTLDMKNNRSGLSVSGLGANR